MKARPTQPRGGRVEVGRKSSRERPLFAEPGKGGNNGKVKPVYLEVCAAVWFVVEIKAIELHLGCPTLRSTHPERGS